MSDVGVQVGLDLQGRPRGLAEPFFSESMQTIARLAEQSKAASSLIVEKVTKDNPVFKSAPSPPTASHTGPHADLRTQRETDRYSLKRMDVAMHSSLNRLVIASEIHRRHHDLLANIYNVSK